MEQSFADQAATTAHLFNYSPPGSAFLYRTPTQQQSSPLGIPVGGPSMAVSGFPGFSFSTTMSQASFGRYQPHPFLSQEPQAPGPTLATNVLPSTNRLRAAVLSAAASSGGAPPIRSRRAGPGPASPGLHAAAVAAATLEIPEQPRRSQRSRKRAPANSRDAARNPPSKKQKRANLKSDPPGNAKSDDGKLEDTEKTASCCICMDEPKPVDLASISGCDHFFCFECIEKWAERENTCPLCKVRFTKIERVNKAKKKGEPAKNAKKVKQKDQRSDMAPGAALEGLLASFASSANFPPNRMARLIFSGMGGRGGNPFAAVLPGSTAFRSAGAAAAERASALEDSLFSSDTDDEEDNSFLPAGGSSFADLFRGRGVPTHRAPGFMVGSGLGAHHGRSLSGFDPPSSSRSYASNGGDRNAGRQAENPLEIEDDSEDEEDVEVIQVTRPV